MEDLIVKNNGFWYVKNDGDGITETYVSPDSCCHHLTVKYPNVPREISQYVPNKRVVVQAGGNVGFYIKQYAELFETVYTFEPDPVLFHCLNLNITSENVRKFQACLGDNNNPLSIGRYLSDIGSTHVTGNGNIPTYKIDDLNLEVCDLIQLDVEGYEFNVLKGAIKTIKRCKPIIVIENPTIWLRRYGATVREFTLFLQSLNYVQTNVLSNNDIMFNMSVTTNLTWSRKVNN